MTKTKVPTRTFLKSAPARVTSSQRTHDPIPLPGNRYTLSRRGCPAAPSTVRQAPILSASHDPISPEPVPDVNTDTHTNCTRGPGSILPSTGHTVVRSRVVCSHRVQFPGGRRQKGSLGHDIHRLTHIEDICAYFWIWLLYNPLIPKGEILHIHVSNQKMKTKRLLCNNFKNLLFF